MAVARLRSWSSGWRPCLLMFASLALAACAAPGASSDAPQAGADRYRLIAGEARSTAGCTYRYRRFVPLPTGHSPARATWPDPVPAAPSLGEQNAAGIDSPDTAVPAVIIGHGFLRDQTTMTDLAKALANAGFQAITLNFCNMRPWNGNHRINALDMQALAEKLGVEHPVYAGFSAGALAAMLATGADPQAAGSLLLDPVDQADIGARAVSGLPVPVEALFGEPSACNAFQQAQASIATAPHPRFTRIDNASHCEFEAPSNWLCELFCGDRRESPGADQRQRDSVIEHAVTAARRIVTHIDEKRVD